MSFLRNLFFGRPTSPPRKTSSVLIPPENGEIGKRYFLDESLLPPPPEGHFFNKVEDDKGNKYFILEKNKVLSESDSEDVVILENKKNEREVNVVEFKNEVPILTPRRRVNTETSTLRKRNNISSPRKSPRKTNKQCVCKAKSTGKQCLNSSEGRSKFCYRHKGGKVLKKSRNKN